MSQSSGAPAHSGLTHPDRSLQLERVIGQYRGDTPGPLLLAVAGLHGNEPSGVLALQRVVAKLRERQPQIRGEFLALAGNLTALRRGVRFVDDDLNRGWSARRVVRTMDQPESIEDHERVELIEHLVPRLRDAENETFVFDLHTTSSPSAPFLTVADTLQNREFARRLGMPLVLGIEEQINGAMLEYLGRFGPISMGIEAGQHDDPASVDIHEAAMWMAMVQSGCLAADTPLFDMVECRRRIQVARAGLPHVFEVVYRRVKEVGDGFRMNEGYCNFEPVRSGQVIARLGDEDVAVPEDGWLFLPLYQELGDDAYFLVRPVRTIWLSVSRWMRQAGVARVLPLLPGVHRARDRDDTYVVDRRVARWLVVQLFHLLGYRRVRSTPHVAVFRGQGVTE